MLVDGRSEANSFFFVFYSDYVSRLVFGELCFGLVLAFQLDISRILFHTDVTDFVNKEGNSDSNVNFSILSASTRTLASLSC